MRNFARETVVCVMGRVRIMVRVIRDMVRVIIRDMVVVFLMLYMHFCHVRSL